MSALTPGRGAPTAGALRPADSVSRGAERPAAAALHRWRAAVRAPDVAAIAWLVVLCLIDAPAPVLAPVLLAGMALALVPVLLPVPVPVPVLAPMPAPMLAARRRRAALALRARLQRPLALPLALFGALLLLNVALQAQLVDVPSQPYFVNIVVLQALLVAWAWIATPRSAEAWRAVHVWSWRLLALLTAIVVVQALVRDLLGHYLDLRLWLTGVPSRSGVEEGSEGSRPTSVFAEPSNHAIVTFLLALIHRVTGPARHRAAVAALLSSLVSASGIGLMLAAVLALGLAGRALAGAGRRLGAGLLGLAALWLASVLVALAPQGLAPAALQRILDPSTGYDPVAVRSFVPQRIAQFEPAEHLLGTGIANYASLDEGLTQYDSSFALGAYYQAGVLALWMLVWLVLAAWRRHSRFAAVLVVALLATKMSLIAPMFWGLCMLLDRRSRCASLRPA